jgi:hypothetical protein
MGVAPLVVVRRSSLAEKLCALIHELASSRRLERVARGFDR